MPRQFVRIRTFADHELSSFPASGNFCRLLTVWTLIRPDKWAWSGSKLLDTLSIPERFFFFFEKINTQMTKSMQNYSAWKEITISIKNIIKLLSVLLPTLLSALFSCVVFTCPGANIAVNESSRVDFSNSYFKNWHLQGLIHPSNHSTFEYLSSLKPFDIWISFLRIRLFPQLKRIVWLGLD